MQKRIDDSLYHSKVSQLNKSAIIDQYAMGVAVLEKVGNLAFFDDRNASNVTNFDVEGCHEEAKCEIIGSVLRLVNKNNAECLLLLNSEKAAERWQQEIMAVAKMVKDETDTFMQRADNHVLLDESQSE